MTQPRRRARRLTRFHAYLALSAALIGAVALLSALTVGRFFQSRVLAHEEEHTAQVVQSQAMQHLTVAEFAPLLTGEQKALFETFFAGLPGIFRVKAFDTSGRVVWSNEPRLVGLRFPDNTYLSTALAGRVITVLEPPKRSEHVYERAKPWVAEAYVPVTLPGRTDVVGVIETYKDMTEVMAGIGRVQRRIASVALGLGALLWGALAVVVWRASVHERRAIERLEDQNRELTLLQQFTRTILTPLDLGGTANGVVESAGSGLGLRTAALYRVLPSHRLVPLATWPAGTTIEPPAEDLVAAVLAERRDVIRGAAIAAPMASPEGVVRVFVATLAHPVSDADRPTLRVLEIMLNEAAIALANTELFTEIRRAHERLAAILAGIADRMVIIDRDMRITWTNAASAADGSDAGRLGRRCYEVFGVDAEACDGCPAKRAFESGRVERGMRVERLPGGDARHLDLVAAPLRDAAGRVHQVLEVARDISELVGMEEQLREAQARLVEQERLAAVGEVVVGLHHAILNPLTGILGALTVLKQEPNLGVRTLALVAEAEAEIRKVEELVRRLPSLRRAEGTVYVAGTRMLDVERAWQEDRPG